MTQQDHNVYDVEQLLKENPYPDDYDLVFVEKMVQVGNTRHMSTIEAYCSGPRLAMLIDEKPNTVEDIFYDYKDDLDLDFDIYCTDAAHAEALYEHLLLKGPHTLIGINTEHESGHFIVIVSVKTLNDKEKFVEALRKLGYNPNGG